MPNPNLFAPLIAPRASTLFAAEEVGLDIWARSADANSGQAPWLKQGMSSDTSLGEGLGRRWH